MAAGALEPPPRIAAIDVSFISLTKVLPHVLSHLDKNKECTLYVLVKPQFELQATDVGKGGIVRSEEARQRALASVMACCETLGLRLVGKADSPIQGNDGNIEYILALKRP